MASTRSRDVIIGIDLVKDKRELEAAYNDSAGITAEFNKNVLASINRSLGGNFDLDAFEHIAFIVADLQRLSHGSGCFANVGCRLKFTAARVEHDRSQREAEGLLRAQFPREAH